MTAAASGAAAREDTAEMAENRYTGSVDEIIENVKRQQEYFFAAVLQ